MARFKFFSEEVMVQEKPGKDAPKGTIVVVTTKYHGCEESPGPDGRRRHVDSIIRMWLDCVGHAIHAEELGDVVVGQCDGSCAHVDRGGFIYEG